MNGEIAMNCSTGQVKAIQNRRAASKTNPNPQTHVMMYMLRTKRGFSQCDSNLTAASADPFAIVERAR